MGATDFMVSAKGTSPKEVFQKLVKEAKHEFGHVGYSGTIAEKDSFKFLPLPPGKNPFDYARELIRTGHPSISDTWGPAGCFLLGAETVTEEEKIEEPPKQTKVRSINQKGTRKWVTYYVLYQDNKEVDKKETKVEALKRAQKLALSTNQDVSIRIEKRLADGNSEVATISPIQPKPKVKKVKKTIEEYLFFGYASQ